MWVLKGSDSATQFMVQAALDCRDGGATKADYITSGMKRICKTAEQYPSAEAEMIAAFAHDMFAAWTIAEKRIKEIN